MSRFILLPATGRPSDAPVFTTALAVARLLGGHLAFLHVRPDVRQDIAAFSTSDFGMGTGIDRAMTEMEQDADAREHDAAVAWRDFCGREAIPLSRTPSTVRVSAEWLTETGNMPAWLAAHGRTADLVVTGRAGENGLVAMEVMETVLLETGRPMLIAPDFAPPPLEELVAIAWKDTGEAASAVAAARPFIRKARRVIVFAVEEAGDTANHSPRRLAHSLRWQNPHVSVEWLVRNGRPPVEVLLDAAVKVGSSLLVMGGYGHTRLREAVFGGFTRAVLEQAPLPVLMAH